MESFNSRFTKFLATGDYTPAQDSAPVPTPAPAKKPASLSPEAVVAQDAAEKYLAMDAAFVGGNAMHPGGKMPKSLAEHDKVHHPDGYKEGDHCKFRENQAKNDEADDLSGTQGATPSSSGVPELETAKNVLAKLRAERGDDNKYVHEWETKDLQGETAYTVFAGVEGGRVRSKDLEEALQEAGIKTARVDIIPGNKLLVTGISSSGASEKDNADNQGKTPSSSGASELETAKNILAKLSAERGDDHKYEWEPKDLQGETGYTVPAGSGRVRSIDLEEALHEAGIKTARAHLLPGNKLLVTGISAS